jgi:hypothetical protein
VSCHTHQAEKPAGGLVLDDDSMGTAPAFGHDAGPDVQVPLTYFRLASWKRYTQPRPGEMLTQHAASRYVTKFQSRRSLLIWKVYGQRLDGYHNDDFPSLGDLGNLKSLTWKGERVPKVDYEDEKALSDYIRHYMVDQDFKGSVMPPLDAVKAGKAKPLNDEDRRTLVRWIDLGCPIDIDPNYVKSGGKGKSLGWMGDDQRPTLTVTYPRAGANDSLNRILVGMADAYSGLDLKSFTVTANFDLDGTPAGTNLAPRFESLADGRWQLQLKQPITKLPVGRLTVSVRDEQGNVSRIERTFSAGK